MIVRVKDVLDPIRDLSLGQRRVIIEALVWDFDNPVHTMNPRHCGEFGVVRVIGCLQEFKTQESLGETTRSHVEHALRKLEKAYIAHREQESSNDR